MTKKNEFSMPQSRKRKCVSCNSSIVKFLEVDKSWVWRVKKELVESEGEYEAIAERSTHRGVKV